MYRRLGPIFMAGIFGVVSSAGAQVSPRSGPSVACGHGQAESAMERERREEALSALRLTARAVDMAMGPGRTASYPRWDDVALAGARLARMDGGSMGRLARQMAWTSAELLPGWSRHYVADQGGYSLELRDRRDPCGWSFVTDERGPVLQGSLLDPGGPRLVPVDSE